NVPPAITIVAPAPQPSLLTGRPVLLGAVATDTEDGNLGATVRWASSRDGALGTGATLVVPSLSVGAHTLTASVTDADGATARSAARCTRSATTPGPKPRRPTAPGRSSTGRRSPSRERCCRSRRPTSTSPPPSRPTGRTTSPSTARRATGCATGAARRRAGSPSS